MKNEKVSWTDELL